MTDFYVYIHRKADTGEVFYVGKGRGTRCNNFRDRNNYWKRTYLKHGVIVEKVLTNLDEDIALEFESFLIFRFRYLGAKLTNLTTGLDGAESKYFTPEVISRMSLSAKNKPKASQSTLLKISNSLIANRDETLYLFRNTKSGETIRCTRQSLAQKIGKSYSDLSVLFTKIGKRGYLGWKILVPDLLCEQMFRFVNKSGQVVTLSMRQFRYDYGISASLWSYHVNNKISSCKGWSLLRDDESVNDAIKRMTVDKQFDETVYTFSHDRHGDFTGTRVELANKFGIDINSIYSLFAARKRKSIKGWKINETKKNFKGD